MLHKYANIGPIISGDLLKMFCCLSPVEFGGPTLEDSAGSKVSMDTGESERDVEVIFNEV